MIARKRFPRTSQLIVWCLLQVLPASAVATVEAHNAALTVTINESDGSYEIRANSNASRPVIRARVAAEVDHHWVKSTDYPQHHVSSSSFDDVLGKGQQLTVTSTGLPGQPDLLYTLQLFDHLPFGVIQVEVQNRTGKEITIQSIRSLEAIGDPKVDLRGPDVSDRILSDSFSEDWPPLQIYDLNQAPNGMHRAVGSQLIYNRESKQSVFFGALSSQRLLTILHLQVESAKSTIGGFTIDSTGTTEIQATDSESALREGPKENLIELNLPVAAGGNINSERVMFAAGNDYHAQLENYGAAIRQLFHARASGDNLLGWWSWTAFYMKITEGNTLTNALWLSEHLKSLGYNYFHFDFGYGYARVEYATPNAAKFPHGMRPLTQRINQLGLNVGIWTAPFEVGERSSVYEQHKDWLVHNAKGEPIQITRDEEIPSERVFVLDATNPGAQEFLRETYRTLVREWGVRYIKLDFMDNTAIEGYYFRPHTTALEAQRIGLDVIRKTVGDDILLDKDGSPMLNPVGLVDEGRVSQDTGHTFLRSKEAAPGIAARYYMHRNFFVTDPDAFTVSRQLVEEREIQAPLTLDEARVSIALAAVSGGMFEIGDDLPTLGADADRAALVTNPDLLTIAKLGRAAVPLDLLSYRSEDEQPSIFLLHEDARQSVLAVFNWTEQARSHSVAISDLQLPEGHRYEVRDVLAMDSAVEFNGATLKLENQPPHSVRLIKIIDTSVAAAAPSIKLEAPANAKLGEEIKLAANADTKGVPAIAYHWDFGDGVTEDGATLTHTYTRAGTYTVQITADGVDGVPARQSVSISVSGTITLPPPRRYVEPSE
jgi:alpha-galactosidase